MNFELSRRRLSPWTVYGYHGEKKPAWEYKGAYDDGHVRCDIIAVRSNDGEILKLEINSHGIQIDRQALEKNLLDYFSSIDNAVLRKPLEEIATEAKVLPSGQKFLNVVVSRVKGLLRYRS